MTINIGQTALLPPEITDPSIQHVRDTIIQIRIVVDRLLELRSQPELPDEFAANQKTLTNLKIMLRGFNREMYLQNRTAKAATAEAKAQFDNLYLNLQNLKYEQQHLRSEIEDCRNYAYAAIP